MPPRAFMERSHIELRSARMHDCASLVEHMPHSVLEKACLRGGVFQRTAKLALWRKGVCHGQQLCSPLEAT